MTQFADSNRVSLRYIQENNATWGVTPTSGKTREMRLTSSSLVAQKDTTVSNELRADRMVSSIIETAAMSEGEVNFEYSAGSFDDFLQAFVLGAWTRPMTFDSVKGVTVTITDTDEITITGKDWSDYFVDERRIKLEGFVIPQNNGYFEIDSVSYVAPNTVIVITENALVAEGGSAYTKIMDANDVIVLKNEYIQTDVNAIKSNNQQVFAAAIAAGQLAVGQKIWLDGLGYQAGTVAFSDEPSVGDIITISDGVNTYAFVAGTDFAVGANQAEAATNLAAAINAKRPDGTLNLRATVDTATVTIVNLNNVAGSIVETLDAANDITVTNFSTFNMTNRGFFTITSATADELGVTPNPGVNTNGAGTYATGSVTFTGTATDGTSVTIDDGINPPVVFVFGTDPGELAYGANADASAANLGAAIQDSIDDGDLFVLVSVVDEVVTITALVDWVGTGASVAETADPDTIITVANFSGGIAGTGVGATLKGSMLRNPGEVDDITAQSFTIETRYNDIQKSMLANGLRVGTFNLNVASGDIVTGSMSFNGKETTPSNAAVLSESPYDALDTVPTEIMNATSNVGAIYKDGLVLSTAVQSIVLQGDASLRNQMAVSSKFPLGIGTGRFQLNGTFTAYFQDLELWTQFIEHETVGIQWDFRDLDQNAYWYTIPALKFSEDPIGPGGIDQDIMEELSFTAFRDPVTECMIQIDRFSSVKPV